MAIAATVFSTEDYEPCTLCSSKHGRSRPSFCQCKHCSIPLCLNCMNEHHNELLQNVAQISHQYNELQDLSQKKQKMVTEITTKSIEDVNQYFETYINELRQTQQNIITGTEKAKQNAQDFLSDFSTSLRTLGTLVEALSKDNLVRPAKLEHLSIELRKLEQNIHTFQAKKSENLTKIIPEFTLEFEYPLATASDTSQPVPLETLTIANSEIKQPVPQPNQSEDQPQSAEAFVTQPVVPLNHSRADNESLPIAGNCNKNDKHRSTKFVIDRMASDGEGVLYTSYSDKQSDIIAYCFMNKYNNRPNYYRDWNQSRIQDITHCKNIKQFVCATEDAIYTVSLSNGKFKIISVLRGKWSYIRVAANSNNIFVHCAESTSDKNEILVCAADFHIVERFNASHDTYLSTSTSFCVTDKVLASICIRLQNYRQVFQVNFFDLKMNALKWFALGHCDDSAEIRSDGQNWFFITTGKRGLHMISPNGKGNIIDLDDNGGCIAVLDDRRLVISNERNSMEIVNYQ